MRKSFLYICFILFCTFCSTLVAQDSTMIRKHPPKKDLSDKLFFGGNIGLQFGTVTFADISPLVGYRFTEKIDAGIGVTYQYYHYKDRHIDFETNVYGGRVFGRYHFTENFFAHLEYEYLNLETFDFPGKRIDVGSLLGGAGYMQHFGRSSGIMAMVLYNFTENAYTPYSNPIFRVGFVIGF